MIAEPRNNLPLQRTSFVGREREVDEVQRLLGTTQLLTLIGAGGCGKTRLALHVAADVASDYPDGACFVELAALIDPTHVVHAVAAALGLREATDRALTRSLIKFMSGKTLLLVLDNCEHVVDALLTWLMRCCGARPFCASWLRAASHSAALVRQPGACHR